MEQRGSPPPTGPPRRPLTVSTSSVVEDYGSLNRRSKVGPCPHTPQSSESARTERSAIPHLSLYTRQSIASDSPGPPGAIGGMGDGSGSGHNPDLSLSRGASAAHLRSQSTSPMAGSSMTTYVNKILGSSSPFSEFRKARNRLAKFRTLLQGEVTKATYQAS